MDDHGEGEYAFYVQVRLSQTKPQTELHGYIMHCASGERQSIESFDDVRRFVEMVLIRTGK